MVDDLISALRTLATDDRRLKALTYFSTRMEVLGVTNPDVRLVVKEAYKSMKSPVRKEILDMAALLVSTNIFECQFAAWVLLDNYKKIISTLTVNEMERVKGILDNWASVDTFGVLIYGVMWREGSLTDREVYKLLESNDFWLRRLAIVGTVALNTRARGGTGDTQRTIAICEKVTGDREDMIEKALSWALRSLIYWDKPAVEAFMEKHYSSLSSRVKREVGHKLEHGTKN